MADIKIKIKVKDEGDNLAKLSDAINGLYPTWQTDNPAMDIAEFIQKLIMENYLIPLIQAYDKSVIYAGSDVQVDNITDILVDHDE